MAVAIATSPSELPPIRRIRGSAPWITGIAYRNRVGISYAVIRLTNHRDGPVVLPAVDPYPQRINDVVHVAVNVEEGDAGRRIRVGLSVTWSTLAFPRL